MRFCGNCGASLEGDSIVKRICPICGMALRYEGEQRGGDEREDDALTVFLRAPEPSSPYNPVYAQFAPPPPSSPPPRRPTKLMVIAVGAAVLLLLVLLVVLLHPSPMPTANISSGVVPATSTLGATSLTQQPTLAATGAATLAPGASATPPATMLSPTATQPSAAQPTATQPVAAQPTATQATATSLPTATLTPPVLNVTPQTVTTKCFDGTFSFTISNGGQSPMNWTAKDNGGYPLDPKQGTLGAGDSVGITASNVTTLSDSIVTVSAVGASGSPVFIKVQCMG